MIDQQRLAADILAGEPCGEPLGTGLMRAARGGRMQEIADLDAGILSGEWHDALTAAIVALAQSGTGRREAILFGKPMVVTDRLGALSYRIVKTLLRTAFVALPNILSGRRLVTELLPEAAEPERLAAASIMELERGGAGVHSSTFQTLPESPRRGANQRAAAVLSLANR